MQRNIGILFDPQMIIGVDDDKVPLRTKKLKKHRRAMNGGRSTRVYPTIHYINTLALGLQIGGFLQLDHESASQTTERMFQKIKKYIGSSSIPNLTSHDRGYDLQKHAVCRSGRMFSMILVTWGSKPGSNNNQGPRSSRVGDWWADRYSLQASRSIDPENKQTISLPP